MEDKSSLILSDFNLPESFFEQVVRDISTASWIRFLQDEPILKESVFEGFSVHPQKLSRTFSQPQLQIRLRRLLRTQPMVLERVLKLWGDEQLSLLAFVEMFDPVFLLENWNNLKNFFGPERFFACLYLMGYLEEKDFRELVEEEFWVRRPEPEIVEILIPIWNAWKSFTQEYPHAINWIEGFQLELAPNAERPSEASADSKELSLRSERKKRLKLESKLEKSQAEQERLHDQLIQYKQEVETLRSQLADWENSFQQRLVEAIEQHRRQWYSRYRKVDDGSVKSVKETLSRLDAILSRANRAFELQRRADEEYGLVAEVRQKLLQVELHLKEIERIYADSLFVHTEVARVKEALEEEKTRILRLPGVEKVLRDDLPLIPPSSLGQQIRLIGTTPENLAKVNQLQEFLNRLIALNLINGLQPLQKEIQHKKQQILETLYERFSPPKRAKVQNQNFPNFEDFVQSGRSKKYDLYLDGYNILFKFHEGTDPKSAQHLPELREDFIVAIARKSYLFRRVYLIFDGTEESRDRRGNLEIIYSNRVRGDTADRIIIDALKRRKDRLALLVTEDNEIIDAVEAKIYAIVGTYHFYMFIYEIDLPFQPGR